MQRSKTQLVALQDSYDNLENQISTQNKDLAQLNELLRELDATRTLYETFLARLKEMSLQVGLHQADSRIMTEALPGRLVSPKRTQIVTMSFMLGGILGVGIVLIWALRDSGVRTDEDLQALIGLSPIGHIPALPIKKRAALVPYLMDNPTSSATEAVRNLRTSILMSNIDRPPKVLMSTSSIPGEGKTTVAISLALNLSGISDRVLLVEGDIRRQTLNEYFGREQSKGIVSIASGDISLEEAVVRPKNTGIDIVMGEKTNLNAADFFSSKRFQDFIAEARAAYDYVIIDTPPVLVVTDARVIVQHCDRVLFSIKWGSTQKAAVKAGLQELRSVGVHAPNIVLSQVAETKRHRYGYGYGYGYGKDYYN